VASSRKGQFGIKRKQKLYWYRLLIKVTPRMRAHRRGTFKDQGCCCFPASSKLTTRQRCWGRQRKWPCPPRPGVWRVARQPLWSYVDLFLYEWPRADDINWTRCGVAPLSRFTILAALVAPVDSVMGWVPSQAWGAASWMWDTKALHDPPINVREFPLPEQLSSWMTVVWVKQLRQVILINHAWGSG
jgi:hypothetical protein